MRRLLAAVLSLMVASSSAQPDECAKLRQDAAQYAAQLLSGLYANPHIDSARITSARATLDSFKREIANCD